MIRLLGAMTVFIVLCNACASANDYTVSCAFEGHDLRDAAQAGCDVAPACELSLVVQLVFFDPTHQRVNISVHEKHGQSGCCYFADAAESVNRDVGSPISLYVYPGHAQPGAEHVPNAPIGILHLLLVDVPKVYPSIDEPHLQKL